MSSGMQSSSGIVRGSQINKTNKTRRAWSRKEEEILLAALKELVADGWKSDNGFRASYLNKLEESMKKPFPTTDLKGMPHINSKITSWKKDYNSVSNMLKITGVGFNLHGTHVVDCTDEQWAHIIKVDNNAKNMRYKSWPYFDDWTQIFRKDRATEDGAEDLMEAAHEMYRNIDLTQPQEVDGDYHVSLDDVNENEPVYDNVSQTQQPEPQVRVAKKSRKRLNTISSRMGYDIDISKARKKVYSQLSSINGLSKKQKFEITNMLAREAEILDVFTSLPEDAKTDYVYYLLEEKNK